MDNDRAQIRDLAQNYREHQGDDQLDLFPPGDNNRSSWAGLLLMAFLAVLLVLGAVGYVKADNPLREKERELLAYISENTGYRTDHIQGRYEFWTTKAINVRFYGERYKEQEDVIAVLVGNTIVLPETFDLERQPEILLHELFHLVVFENDIQFPCLALEEQAAYTLSNKYVIEERNGFGILASPLYIMMLRCNPHR